ncbi:MAG TPA: peptide-methionine (S)-S-oxide reductase MsrA [Cellvibrionaceae bacterium]|nr:peptide-methionine (S)-S-oxide reductase MsrA [Cellvibrionaceae bacterium]HMY38281.1 peptide-methionine (S)-S-oxide reductase MsrA [Marinagarivorans sp.]HNG59654.1 peptide-methionine (S)-S-oxide reductase MsrA [Cellvibrionaceae bacterium]
MWSFERKKQQMVSPEAALPGRTEAMPIKGQHSVLGLPLTPPYPSECQQILFGMGCFWGAERVFWNLPGVHVTAVGYSGGYTPNPLYEEVCSGLTGHNEVVLVVYRPRDVSVEQLLQVFWQSHNPTTPMQQANDIGTQYRSGIYCYEQAQLAAAQASKEQYQALLGEQLAITTEIKMAEAFYFAESYHQQYLAKNPGGYCNLQTVAKTGLPTFEPK